MMPSGDLRDVKSSSKRAHIIIVTKCKPDLSEPEKESIIHEIKPMPDQQVFFTTIEYGQPYQLYNKQQANISASTGVLLVCGIANPKPLMEYLTNQVHTYDMLRFPDHHIFKIDDLTEIKDQFKKLSAASNIILTTEKDAVRLEKFKDQLAGFPFYVLPIRHRFLFNEAAKFENTIINTIKSFQTKRDQAC